MATCLKDSICNQIEIEPLLKRTTCLAKQWIAVVIAHELAHQWFGNLVTMKWWNDLWLNEGKDNI